jgi:hypothetical protein
VISIPSPSHESHAGVIHAVSRKFCIKTSWGCFGSLLPPFSVHAIHISPPRASGGQRLETCFFVALQMRSDPNISCTGNRVKCFTVPCLFFCPRALYVKTSTQGLCVADINPAVGWDAPALRTVTGIDSVTGVTAVLKYYS